MAHMAHYKEAHPLPFVITHWINLVCMVLLILTGIIIHYPSIPDIMGMCRGVHIFCGFLLFLNCLVRVIMTFFVKSSPVNGSRQVATDIKNWLPQADNRHQAGAWIKYYLFLKKDHPLYAKLGVPQKLSYLGIPILIFLMFWTGLCLWGVTMNVPCFAATTELVGGAMSMRIIHYFGMYVFIAFMIVHGYMALIEGTSLAKLMFFRKEHGGLVYDPDAHNIVGEDNSIH